MDRRKFILSSSIVAGGVLAKAPNTLASANSSIEETTASLIKPKALKKGDTIGLITPGSAISRGSFEKTLQNIEDLGFKVKYSDNMRVRKGFLAGADAQRIDDIHSMFDNSNIDGIICARGGYGSARLLPFLDYELIKSNPKVLLGYSDITALLYGIFKKTNLVCFHGPVGASTYTPFTTEQFEKVLIKGKNKVEISQPKDWKDLENPAYNQINITSGVARGALVGGNLSLMVSLIGTPYDVDYTGKIVFIEEIGESTYRVDRMLTQLLLSGKLDNAKGVALGIFKDFDIASSNDSYGISTSLKEVLLDRLAQLNVPCIYGFPIGHIADNATLPFGIEAELDAQKGRLTLLDSAVV